MGFLKSLFGSSSNNLGLHDEELGELKSLRVKGSDVTWSGETKFLDQTVSIYIHGSPEKLNDTERAKILEILSNQTVIEKEINIALKDQYENAEKDYSNWSDHFNCISVTASGKEIEITFEEKESLYHFNVFFLDNKGTGVSIDS